MTTPTSNQILASLAASARQSSLAATTGSAAGASSAAGTATANSGAALNALSSNFDDFLKLLTTQLQNQDPSSPMDTNTFTTQLVQFSSVEQQVQTNSNLTQLLQLTEDGQLGQSSGLIGKAVNLTGSTVPLQGARATIDFTTAAAAPVAISITNAAGQDVRDAEFTSAAGANSWTWDGTSNSGAQLADGAYKVAVKTADASGAISDVAFTSVGTPTDVERGTNGLTVDFGAASLDYAAIQSLAH